MIDRQKEYRKTDKRKARCRKRERETQSRERARERDRHTQLQRTTDKQRYIKRVRETLRDGEREIERVRPRDGFHPDRDGLM